MSLALGSIEFAIACGGNATTLAEACTQAEEMGRTCGAIGGTFRILDRCALGSVLGSHEVDIRLVDGLAVVR